MDLQKIECFLAVAHHLNFSRAAQYLYMAQSSVTQQIKTMESELGFRLLERSRKGVKLTGAGLCLRDDLEKIVGSYASAIQRARQIAINFKNHIAVGYPNPPEWGNMPQFISSFRQDYTDVDVHLQLGKGRQLLESFQVGALDVMFGDLEYLQQLNVEVVPLFRAPAYVLVPHGHPLEGNALVGPDEINNYKAFCLSPDTHDATIGILTRRLIDSGIDFARIYPVRHREDVVASVYAGMGLGIVPGTLTRRAYQVHIALLDASHAYFEFGCVKRKGDVSPMVDSFMKRAHSFSWIGEPI